MEVLPNEKWIGLDSFLNFAIGWATRPSHATKFTSDSNSGFQETYPDSLDLPSGQDINIACSTLFKLPAKNGEAVGYLAANSPEQRI